MCTCFVIKSADDQYFLGRTMDFLYDLTNPDCPFAAQVRIEPAGHQYEGQLETWEGKYKVGGAAQRNHESCFYDAINDQGLVGELNALVESGAGTAEEIKANHQHALMGEELVSYFVSHFASVAEVRQHYQEYAVLDTPYKPYASDKLFDRLPCHYIFTDKTGDSVVLEPVDGGKLRLFESIGVLTNSPTYDWHLTNLRNYVNLTGHNAGDTTIPPIVNKESFKAEQVGFGSGLLGIPGDYTSTSRFVRSVFLTHYADPFPAKKGLNTLFNLFNSVFVPKGVEKMEPGSNISDHTEYWAGYDISNLTFVVRPQQSNTFLKKSLNDFDDEAVFDLPTQMTFA